MKCCSMRTVGASLFCLCILIGLSGCIDILLTPELRAWKKQQEEQMRQVTEAQQQQQAQKLEQEKRKAAETAQISGTRQDKPSTVKAHESEKTESVGQGKDIKNEISEEKSEPDDLPRQLNFCCFRHCSCTVFLLNGRNLAL